jgi:hypothetical protein
MDIITLNKSMTWEDNMIDIKNIKLGALPSPQGG